MLRRIAPVNGRGEPGRKAGTNFACGPVLASSELPSSPWLAREATRESVENFRSDPCLRGRRGEEDNDAALKATDFLAIPGQGGPYVAP